MIDESKFTMFGVPFRQTVTAPQDVVEVHPFMVAALLNALTDVNGTIDIYKHHEETDAKR